MSQIPLGFGTASISGEGGGYGFGAISEDEAISLLHFAYDLGIRLFDTAPIYGFGLAEKRLGKAFSNRRDQIQLISKSGVAWDENKRVDRTNDPKIARRMLEQSLRDLQTEYLDVYMIHWPDERVDIRHTTEVLAQAKEEGKIREIGLSNTSVEDLDKAREVTPIDWIQLQCNLFVPIPDDLKTYCRDNEIKISSWGTFYKGILTGRVDAKRKFDKHDARSWAPWWKEDEKESKYRAAEKLKNLVRESEVSLSGLAMKYALQDSDVVLVGTRSQEQCSDAVAALTQTPSETMLADARSICAG